MALTRQTAYICSKNQAVYLITFLIHLHLNSALSIILFCLNWCGKGGKNLKLKHISTIKWSFNGNYKCIYRPTFLNSCLFFHELNYLKKQIFSLLSLVRKYVFKNVKNWEGEREKEHKLVIVDIQLYSKYPPYQFSFDSSYIRPL